MNLRGEELDPRALGERMSSDKGLIQAVGHRQGKHGQLHTGL